MECYIENLSNNDLLRIFEYLDAKTLKNAALVCKTWNDVITNSVATMKKFKILVNQFKNYENIMKVNRMVYTLAVQFEMERWGEAVNVNENPLTVERKVQMLSEICSRHGSKIRSFYIYNAQFDRPEDFTAILNSMPLLQKFNSMKVNLNFAEEYLVTPAVLNRLMKLQVSMTGFDFRCLYGSRPEIVSLINLQRSQVRFLNEFVESSLDKMQTLTLTYNVAINMFLDSVREFKFQLQELKIQMSPNSLNDIETINENQIINFFSSQATSLKRLSLREASSKILKASFQSFPLLEKLNLYAWTSKNDGSVLNEKRLYDCLQELKNLKELTIHNVWNDTEVVKGVLSKCPALKKLEMTGKSGCLNIIDIIAKSNPNIEHLKLSRLTTDDKAEMQLKLLKSFHLTRQNNDEVDYLIAFLRNNATIEKLVIEYLYIPERSVTVMVNTLVNMPNLKSLEIASHLDVVKSVYEGFSGSGNKRSICAVLGIELTGLGGFVRQMGPRKFTFKFPEEAGHWDEKVGSFIESYKQRRSELEMRIKRFRQSNSSEN